MVDEQRLRLVVAVVLVKSHHPLLVGDVDGDLAGEVLARGQLLVALRQLLPLQQLGIEGGRVVVRGLAVPAPARITRLRRQRFGLRHLELLQHVGRQARHAGRRDDVPGPLVGTRLDGDAAVELHVGAAHVLDLDAGRRLEQLEDLQAFLLVDRGVDDDLAAFRLGGGHHVGSAQDGACAAAGAATVIASASKPDRESSDYAIDASRHFRYEAGCEDSIAGRSREARC